MICFQCQEKFYNNGILVSADGDFVCNEKCQKDYECEKAKFFNEIVYSEEKTKQWLLGKIK